MWFDFLSWLIVVVFIACSVQFFDSLWPHGLQHARLPCPSPTWACSDSCPLNRWCHSTISSSVVPFSSRLQCFPASGSFLMSQLFTSGGQSIGASASTSVLPMNISGLISFRMDWLDGDDSNSQNATPCCLYCMFHWPCVWCSFCLEAYPCSVL